MLNGQSFIVDSTTGYPTGMTEDASFVVRGGLLAGWFKTSEVAVASSADLESEVGIGTVDVAGIERYAVSNSHASSTSREYYYLARGFLEDNGYIKLTPTLSSGAVVKSALSAIGA